MTSPFSTLSKGSGSWTGIIDNNVLKNDNLPSLDSNFSNHRHGVTVTPRSHTTLSGVSVADGGYLELPKTYLTRKGALMLFTAPNEEHKDYLLTKQSNKRISKQKNLIDLSLKLKTLEKLSLSILEFGSESNENYPTVETDKDKNLFINFLHKLNQEDNDLHSQPGADLRFYLKDLKRRASCRTHSTRETSLYRSRTSELQDILDDLENTWPHQREKKYSICGEEFLYSPSPTVSQGSGRALSRHRVLSSKKLASSLKSVTYLGRPLTADGDENIIKAPSSKYVRSKSATALISYKHEVHEKKRPQSAPKQVSPEESKSMEQTDLAKSNIDSSEYLEETTCKYEEESEEEFEESDNEWYENTIKVNKILKPTVLDKPNNEDLIEEDASSLSLFEDEDIAVPYGDYSEEEETNHALPSNENLITEDHQQSSDKLDKDSPVTGIAQPLHPQYLNVLNEGMNILPFMDKDVEHVASRASLNTPFQSTVSTSPVGDTSAAQDVIKDNNKIQTQEVTVLQKLADDLNEQEYLLKKHEERAAKLAAMDYLLKASNTTQEKVTPQVENVSLPTIENKTEIEEEKIQEPLPPKRRVKPVEIKTATMDTDDEKEEDSPKDTIKPQFSERVIKEKEERERKSAKLKEEKEKAEAKKKEQEEKIKKEKEEKIKEAEERLKIRAQEAAKKKEEAASENENIVKLQDDKKAKLLSQEMKKPTPPTDKKVNVIKGKEKVGDLKKAKKQNNAYEKQESEPTQPRLTIKNNTTPPLSQKIVATKQEPEFPDHIREMISRKSQQETEKEMEEGIIKMKKAVDNVLGNSVVKINETEGFTEEDFKEAQEALQEKIKKAEENIIENASPRNESKKVLKSDKPSTMIKKGKLKMPDFKKDLAKERELLREQQRQEKQRRLEEAKELQQKIQMKEEARKAKEAEAKKKAEELRERMDSIRREEEELERAELDAREQLAAVRKAQREEREARRKADLERKKQDAIQKREKEKAMALAAKLKEQEMLESIADAEMVRRLKEEEEAKREEEETAAQERLEAEFIEAQKAAEEEEERLREMERQAEEEAFQRLLNEKEEAERRRWQLEEQARVMKEEEDRVRYEMLEEEKKLEEEKQKHDDEEQWRKEQEKSRLRELQRLEEEARLRLQAELDKRRAWALQRRDKNLEVRNYMDRIKQSQGITEPWTFSYFVKWPKENYMRLMGTDPKKIKGSQRPKPKQTVVKENIPESEIAVSTVDVQEG